jgi:pimeloyl-ACP methyl ester carboxylesterase
LTNFLWLKALLVAKDFGAFPAYWFSAYYPERTCGVISIGIPFSPTPVSFDSLPEGFYIKRWRVLTFK